jgi:phosphomevalonate kinase
MNERIKELAEQAGPNIVKEFDQEDIDFCEKFAELIVKETMQVVANQLPSNQYLDVAHAVIEHYKDNDAT